MTDKITDVNEAGKPAFTPGPWVAERRNLDGNEWFINSISRELPPYNWLPRLTARIPPLHPISGRGVDAHSGMGASYSDAHFCPTAVRENAANARLISASPDLLEALQAFLAMYIEGANSGDWGNWNPEEEPEIIAARAAIAKALGQ